MAIIVIVAGRDSHTVTCEGEAGLFRHVHELQFAGFFQHVSEQPITRLGLRGGREQRSRGRFPLLHHRALDQKYFQIPIAVVIEERHARAHDLWQVVLAGCAGEVTKS